MPVPCFSYTSDVPPGIPDRGAAQPAVPGHRRMPAGPCFSYGAGLPARDLRRMPSGPCFSYTTDVRRMPVFACFGYPADPPGRDLRRMPATSCFSYPAGPPPGVRNRNAAP
jgi:hypothetical protein